MSELVLRNSRLDSGTWCATAAGFALAGLVGLGGLVLANVHDPAARWMGSNVLYPQTIYLIFDGVLLLLAAAMAWLAVVKARQFFDRSVRLLIDADGIHDRRPPTRHDLPWSQVAALSDWALASGGIVTAARLLVETRDGEKVGIDVLGLDQDPKAILKAAKKIMRQATRGG
jgi:hypothetical protein